MTFLRHAAATLFPLLVVASPCHAFVSPSRWKHGATLSPNNVHSSRKSTPFLAPQRRHAQLINISKQRRPQNDAVVFFADSNDTDETSSSTATSFFTTTTTEDSVVDDNASSLTTSVIPHLEASRVGGLLLPLARLLEDATDGWALTYADLSPETHTTPVGMGFLATNLAYTICGLLLVGSGNALLGVLVELCSVASFAYHFCQLKLGSNQPLVRIALLVDYVVAASTLLAALVYILQSGIDKVPLDGILFSVLAVIFLFLSWVWEEGLPYVINHGLWHILGAYAGYLIGQAQYINTGNA